MVALFFIPVYFMRRVELNKDLETLIELQQVDKELLTLNRLKGDLPAKVNKLSGGLEALEEKLSQEKIELDDAQTLKRSQEGQAEILQEKLAKFQTQLYQVKNNKEYDAITTEIEEGEKKLEEVEYSNMELEDQIKAKEEALEALAALVETDQTALSQLKEELTTLVIETQEQETALQTSREEIEKRLSRQILSNYDRIRAGRDGVALSYLEKGACVECSSRVPPQRGVEIRLMDRFIPCETCGRFLIWKDTENNIEEETGN